MKFGLLGKSLQHSFSKQIHTLFELYDYEYFEREESELNELFQHTDLKGLNVTIPYKRTVMKYLDEISPEARRIGCVNTVVFKEGKKYGFNTDYDGFLYNLTRKSIDIQDKKCLILGEGATSDTVSCVLEDLKAKSIIKVSRNGAHRFDEIEQFDDAEIIINCTPVGMYPNNGESLVNLDHFPSLIAVVDVIYNPFLTKLLLDAKKRGLKIANGFPMLVGQAKKAAELFTNIDIKEEKIEQIIKILMRQLGNIVLIGMPGCGKTTIGEQVAYSLSKKFIDLDEEIEREYGPIPEIFRTKGEEAFRKMEHEMASRFGKMSDVVISTGGGIITRSENYNPLKQNALIYWIKRDLEDLPTEGRPLSLTNNLEDMYRIRKPLYHQFSDLEIKNDLFDETIQKIVRSYYENSID